MARDYDMVVIGAGAAGLTAAGISAVLGARTALVEVAQLGGDCTWHGCIPSKSLLRAATIAHHMRDAARYGLEPADPPHDFARIMHRVRSIRRHIYEEADAPPNFEKLGVEVIQGRARFTSPHEIQIDGARRLSSRRFVIATGSSPRLPEFEHTPAVPVLTNETLFELDRLPPRLLVLGAGPVGIEMAQAFRRLGSQVTVATRSHGILSRDDAELSALLLDRLRAEGIGFRFGEDAARASLIDTDAILAATGREPNIAALDLAAAGVRVNDRGIVVDSRCRTSARHIYAAGDVTGRHLFTHYADHMGKTAATNAILRVPTRLDERSVPWTTFTDPELAHIGATESELTARGVRHDVYRFPFSQLDRALTDSAEIGMVKVLATRWGRVLGVSILGAHAGEMIGEYALAMRNRIRLDAISSTIHPYPTYGLGNRRAADLFFVSKLTPTLSRWLKRLLNLRG